MIKKIVMASLLSWLMGSCNQITNMTPAPDYTGYQPAVGEVSYVYEARLRRQGYHAASYRVVYTPPGTDKLITVDGNLVLKQYKKGDSVAIYYNPGNPEDVVTDKIDK